MEHPCAKVGVAILLFKDGKILLGRRIGERQGTGKFSTPGGHLEYMEAFSECATREVAEEVGLEINEFEFVGVVNVRSTENYHSVIIVLRAEWKSGEPKNMEPDCCEGWAWYGLDELPSPLTSPTQKGIEAYKTGKMLFE